MVSSAFGLRFSRKSKQTNDGDGPKHNSMRRHSWEESVPTHLKESDASQRGSPITGVFKRQGELDRAASSASTASGGSGSSSFKSGSIGLRTASAVSGTSSASLPLRTTSSSSNGSDTEKKQVMTMERALKEVTDVNNEIKNMKRLMDSFKTKDSATEKQRKMEDALWVENMRGKIQSIYVLDANQRQVLQTLLDRIMTELNKLLEG
eukprot:3315376-Rhodomonas_salina.5